MTTLASSAAATPLTLEYLVHHDAEIHSTDGTLEFEDFSAHLSGAPGEDLSRFLVITLVDGLRLEVTSGEFLPTGAELFLHFEVETEDDDHHPHHSKPSDPIRSMSLALTGGSVLSTLTGEMVAIPEDDDEHHPSTPLAEVVAALITPPGPYGAADFSKPSHEFYAAATFRAGDGYPGADASTGAEMRFSTQPIPEPSSALLLGLGLLLLSRRGGARS